jgi:hypothetical protein
VHARCRNGRTALLNQRVIAIPHRMRHHHKRQIVVANALRGHLRQRRECGTHHGNGRNSQRFQFGRVTRGPGR